MINVEKLITYDDEKEQNSITFSIISSSFYSNKISFEKSSLEKKVLFEKISFQLIASTFVKVTKKNKIFQKRFKFIFRDEDDWITIKEYFFDSFFFSKSLQQKIRKRETIFIWHNSLFIVFSQNALKLLWQITRILFFYF